MIISLADIFGFCGMGFFLTATISQYFKIYKTHHTTAISLLHYKLKIVAILCSLTCFGLAGLLLSFTAVSMELIVSLGIIYLIIKYRK